MEIPFYQKIRPDKLEDMVGQKHILSEGMIIEKLYRQKKITNMIMYMLTETPIHLICRK